MTNSVQFHIRKTTLSPHYDPSSFHPPHPLTYRRHMGLASCATSQVLWQLITLILEAFKHVVFKIILIIECLLGHYSFDLVSPW
jgi:hypothetical protein